MNFLKSNYKMILVIGISIIVQFGVVIMLFNTDNKDKKEIDSTIGRQDASSMLNSERDMDAIDEAKSNTVNGLGNRDIKDIIEGEDEYQDQEIRPVSQVGRLDVQVGYIPTETSDNKTTNKRATKPKTTANIKSIAENKTKDKTNSKTSNKAKAKNNTKNNNSSKKTDIAEKEKKIIVGKWKSVNDSEGRKADMYWEFFSDGNYQNYDEERSVVFNGKYTITSPNIIKIDQDNVYISTTGSTRDQKEVFSADIKFKGNSEFSVTDTGHFEFTNYKK